MLPHISVRMVYMSILLVCHGAKRGDTAARCLTKFRTLGGRSTGGSID